MRPLLGDVLMETLLFTREEYAALVRAAAEQGQPVETFVAEAARAELIRRAGMLQTGGAVLPFKRP